MLSYSLIIALVSTAVLATDIENEGDLMPDRFGLGFHKGLGGDFKDGRQSSRFDFGLDLLGQSGFNRHNERPERPAKQPAPAPKEPPKTPEHPDIRAGPFYENDRRDYRDYLAGYRAQEPAARHPRDPPAHKPAPAPVPKREVPRFSKNPLSVDDLNNRQLLLREKARMDDGASKWGEAEHELKPYDSWKDFRDYDPLYYGMGADEWFADCKWPADPFKLNTPDYQGLSAKCKEEVVWKNTLMDSTREKFYTGFGLQEVINQDMRLSYDVVSDTMPNGRVKRTHPVGTMTKVELVPHPDTPYTGLFRGAKHGVMRISETFIVVPHVAKTVPGHAVKFFRDGMYSGNFVAMFSFDGQKSYNFFKNRWTTILREPNNECAQNTIGKNLASVTDHMGATSVMDMAEFDQYGNEEKNPHWPYQMDVEPYDVFDWKDEYQNDMQDQMREALKPNQVLFKLFGFDEPPEIGGKDRLIGWLVSRSETIDSWWGDTQLFFQHRRMDDDIKKRPHYFDWLQFWDRGHFHETSLLNPAPPVRCPFYYLFHEAGLI